VRARDRSLALAALCALFAAPRIGGVCTEFWLDEVWALDIVSRISSPLDVFTRVHFDTNHWLYSLWLYAVAPRDGFVLYRLPALVAGLAALPLGIAIARRDGDERAAGFALALLGGSFLLIEYSSEARGYALAVAFALGAFLAELRMRESLTPSGLLALNAGCVLGLLSHLTFLFPWAGLLAWSAARLDPRRTFACHALPLAVFAALYWLDIRHIQHGAGPEAGLWTVLGQLAALVLGFSQGALFGAIAAAVCTAVAAAGIFTLRADGSRIWVFFAVTLFAAPAVVVAVRAPDFPYWTERHFLVCVPFLLLLAASLLARASRRGRAGAALAAALLALYLAGNALHTADFLRLGRGHYAEAVAYMLERDPEPELTVGSDHDFRNSMLLAFHARALPAGRSLAYLAKDAWPADGPRWLIVHSLAQDYAPAPSYVWAGRVEYELARHFPYAGVSGWHWALYRRSAVAGGVSPGRGAPGTP